MLTIRMQRTGRTGLASFRVIVQDSQFSPTSGRVVATLGSYNPHTKEVVLDKERTETYLKNGAQPSERMVRILQKEKIALPGWVEQPANDKKRTIKNPEKLRKNRPEEPQEEAAPEPEEPESAAEDNESTSEPAAPAEKTEEPAPEADAKEDDQPTEEKASEETEASEAASEPTEESEKSS